MEETNDLIFDPYLGEWRSADGKKTVIEKTVEIRGGKGTTEWGEITGDLTDQTDLDNELNEKKDRLYIEPMRGWQTAVSNMSNAAANVVLLGDSTTTLHGRYLEDLIHSNYNIGINTKYYIPNVFGRAWTTWTGTANQTTHGLGNWGGTLDASTSDEGTLVMDTSTEWCTAFTLYYTKQQSGGCNLEVYIDAVLQTTINTTDAGLSTSQESGFSWTSADLQDNTAHTLRIVATGTGTALVDGAMAHDNSQTTGVNVYNAGHSGYTVALFEAQESTYQAIKNISPDLTIINLGINDYVVLSKNATTFKSNLENMVDQLQTDNPLMSIMLVAPYCTRDYSSDPEWAGWMQVYYDVAEDKNLGLVDLYKAMGDVGATNDVYDLSSDNIHLTTKGSRIWSQTMADAIFHHDIHTKSPALRQDGSVSVAEAFLTDVGDKGSVGFGSFFGNPAFILTNDTAAGFVSYWLLGSGIAGLLTFPSATFGIGDGSTGNPDINFSRSGAAELSIFGASGSVYSDVIMKGLTANAGSIIDGTADEVQLEVQAHSTQNTKLFKLTNSGGTNLIDVSGTGVIEFGGSADTNLYRSAADTLKTDDNLVVGTRLLGLRPFIELTKSGGSPEDINWGATGTEGYIGWDTQTSIDTDHFTHSTSTNNTRITVDVTGRYRIRCSLKSSNAGANRFAWTPFIRVNGSTITRKGGSSAYSRGAAYNILTHASFDTDIELTANDYIEVGTRVDCRDQTTAVTIQSTDCQLIIERLD